MKPRDFATRGEGTRGIIGVGDKDDPCRLGHARKDRVNIARIVVVGCNNHSRAHSPCRNFIHRKAVFHMDHFITVPGISASDEVKDFIRTRAVNNPRRIKIIFGSKRFTQIRRTRVGIAFKV